MVSRDLRLRFPRGSRHATRARKALSIHLERLGIDRETRADLERAGGEAIANAVEHGLREGSYFEVRIRLRKAILRIEVEDDGLGFHPSRPRREDVARFGITIMRSLVDSVAFFKGGRVVRLEKRISMPQFQSRESG